ncbi:MAG: hypothetical protein KIT62_15080 [Cyclobacteriaceae bacterium]|nr:hypothetical protein [Cyclobacteriaceae bacterium]
MKNSNRTRKAECLLMFCFLSMGASCENSVPCTSSGEYTAVNTLTFFDMNTPYAWIQNVSDSESMVNLIIRDQQNYEEYVGIRSDTLRPAIDFNNYSLLAGRVKASYSDEIIHERVIDNCNGLLFEVRYGGGALQVITTINYFAIVPTGYSSVSFDIKRQ